MAGYRKGLRLLPFALLNERRSINVGSGGEGIFLRSIFSQISDTSYLGGILRFEGGASKLPKFLLQNANAVGGGGALPTLRWGNQMFALASLFF